MRWTLTLMMMTLALPQAVHAQAPEAPPRVPPAPGCLDARQMAEVRQASSTELAVQGRDGQRFRITLSEGCPGAGRADAVLLAREGWVCGTGQEYVRIGEATCAVTGIAAIDAREYAAMARAASMQTADGVTTLETVEVRAPQRRGFAGSSSFCFNPRYMRAWSEDSEGMLVELSPRRSGGHRYYRVELAHGCPDLDSSPAITFRSGVGIGLICGNPGDRVVAQDSGDGSLFDSGDAGMMFADDERRWSRRGIRVQCSVSAVYPHEPASRNAAPAP
jgi:hypothetical protein